ncbi:C-C motif chemokine 26-like [Archocentrus centrarchus]|uniref:C-C motif chemokine 26-like n=1 Tax=Archocentrus centrarchus TaxID=63155 RepID=UPI0011E9F622|nr:C-C motif chemokine 26-like [Archocentrus centrarchus]
MLELYIKGAESRSEHISLQIQAEEHPSVSGTMKTLLALTVLVLLCFLKHSSANVGVSLMMRDVKCCETTSDKIHIPFKKVKHVVMTSGCSPEAIIVTTVADRKICLDPKWKHAQMHLEEFKKN